MIIGLPKEIKTNEYRVAATPSAVAALVRRGNTVLFEADCGKGSGFSDESYIQAGGQLRPREEVYQQCDMLYKVKEIEPSEYSLLHPGQTVFTYLHSNAHPEMTRELLERGVTGIAYEDIDDDRHEFPALAPMSVLAGKGGFLAALYFSQSVHGGNGLLLNRIAGVPVPEITIIGCGNSGMGAAELAAAFGNRVTMLDVSWAALERAKESFSANVETLFSNRENLELCLKRTDVLINCILWDKTRTDHLVSREDLKLMKPGSIIVDVACDDHGAIETCRSTSHDDPVYFEEGVLHYAVDNIPSAFSRTASQTLSAATLPYALAIAQKGVERALLEDPHLRRGLTTYRGMLTLEETAKKQGVPYVEPKDALGRGGSEMGLLKDFAPQRVLKHLEDLLAIPHGSGHEAALGDHILALARRRSLPACRDGAGNILVRVPASPEGKGAPPVLVQGHMDMVLAQEPEVDRDLTVQPVELVLEGSVLRADRTTLGADNGVGLCTMMALMEADDLPHPPLELLFTVEEETGFTGILNFDMGQLKARRMIQMDCGDPDCLVMGAAGGAQYTLSRTCGICPGGAGLRVRVSGLRGGHSGLEMGKNRGSALDLCGRLLAALCQQMPVRLGLLTTPNQGSSIPQEAALSFLPPEGRREEAREICQSCFCQFHEELLETEPDFSASLEDCPLEETASEADTQALASFLLLLPYEALRRDTEHPAWVLCSALLTQAGCTGGRFFGKYAIRANLNSYRDAAALRFQQLCRLTGVEAEQTAPFLPAWPQRRDSPLRQVCLDAFARRFGRPMSVEVEHGTVEVGILVGAIPDMDAVGFAPKSRGAHTTREHLYLETVEPFWQLFCDVLERLCQE